MFLKVANDDIESFKNNNKWLSNHPNNALIFSELNEVWKKLSPIYNNSFRKITYGDFPDETEILKTLNRIKERLSKIEWNIKIN